VTFEEHLKSQMGERRLWMLVPIRREAYVPGFEGTFEEALVEAAAHAAFWKTATRLFEADPAHYRTEKGLKKLWATIEVPRESPLREPGNG
jgi:hypothetical protein